MNEHSNIIERIAVMEQQIKNQQALLEEVKQGKADAKDVELAILRAEKRGMWAGAKAMGLLFAGITAGCAILKFIYS